MTIELIAVSNSSELCDELKLVYLNSFPTDERRDWTDLVKLIDHPDFGIFKLHVEMEFVGFISTWNLPVLIFIEHFALKEDWRNKGLGSKALSKFIEEKTKKVILEVEEPDSDFAKRRIAFYQRLNFHINDKLYYQPPYSTDKQPVKMQLMSFPDKLNEQTFNEIKTSIHKLVYNYVDTEMKM